MLFLSGMLRTVLLSSRQIDCLFCPVPWGVQSMALTR